LRLLQPSTNPAGYNSFCMFRIHKDRWVDTFLKAGNDVLWLLNPFLRTIRFSNTNKQDIVIM
jgi:hypothetical protein